MELVYVVFRGPCCWAFLRYEAKEFGRASGAAGGVWGVWSTLAGAVRLPMNLIIGVRCERRRLVACIVIDGRLVVFDVVVHGARRVAGPKS